MNKFTSHPTPLPETLIIEPTVFGDERGFFMETFAERDFRALGITEHFVQDNHSKSRRGVLRGVHFQREHSQGKLIRVIAGAVLDVAVDLRPESPSFGQWTSVVLSAANKRQFYIPPRMGHGFLTLEENTEFLYKCTDYYAPEFDGGVRWNDPQIAIDWELEKQGLSTQDLILSEKDQQQPLFREIAWVNLWR